MTEKAYKTAKRGGGRVAAEVRRDRAFGDYDRTAREAQRRASAYGRARGNS